VGAVTFKGTQLPQELVSRAVLFYAEVFSFIDYLSQQIEPQDLRLIMDRLAGGLTTEKAMTDVKGLPPAAALERAWISAVTK
jgi:hypothetical protein